MPSEFLKCITVFREDADNGIVDRQFLFVIIDVITQVQFTWRYFPEPVSASSG